MCATEAPSFADFLDADFQDARALPRKKESSSTAGQSTGQGEHTMPSRPKNPLERLDTSA